MAEIPGFDLEDRTKVDFRISADQYIAILYYREKKHTHTQHAGDGDRQFYLIFISSLLCTKHWPQTQSKPLFFNQAKIKNQSSFVSL
ncbi:hypothetical protein ACE6H2_002752 [Prunus campanulata]